MQKLFASDAPRLMEQEAAAQAARDRSSDSTTGGDTARPLLNVESGSAATAQDREMKFSFLAGVVNEEDRARFERMLFRATKGK